MEGSEEECIREDRIITFDVRGTVIKTYASTIQFCDSAFFRGILGTGGMQTRPQADGSFFVDCNPNDFYSILAYIETGYHSIPMCPHLNHMCKKFDIPVKQKRKIKIRPQLKTEMEKFLSGRNLPDGTSTLSIVMDQFMVAKKEENTSNLCIEFLSLGNRKSEFIVSNVKQIHCSSRFDEKFNADTTITVNVDFQRMRKYRTIATSQNIFESYFDFMNPLKEKYKCDCVREIYSSINSVKVLFKFRKQIEEVD